MIGDDKCAPPDPSHTAVLVRGAGPANACDARIPLLVMLSRRMLAKCVKCGAELGFPTGRAAVMPFVLAGAYACPQCGEVHNARVMRGIELQLRSRGRKRIRIIACLVVVTATIGLWVVYR